MRFFSVRCRTMALSVVCLVIYVTVKIVNVSNGTLSTITETKFEHDSQLNFKLGDMFENIGESIQNISQDEKAIPLMNQDTKHTKDTENEKPKEIPEQIVKKPSVPVTSSLKCDTEHLHKVPKSVQENCRSKKCADITCHNLLYSKINSTIHGKTRKWMLDHKTNFPDATQLQSELQSSGCDAFKQIRGYKLEALSEEEADFPIAYNIVMHKDLSQIEKLLRVIYRIQNIYCIHVDAKVSQSFMDAMRSLVNCFPNVFIASKLERIVYAGFSRLQADINCMKDLTRGQHQWRYLINIAGQALPLKTNAEIVQILKIYNGSNDIEGLSRRVLKSRFQNEFLETGVNTSHPKIIKTEGKRNPPPPDDIAIVRGSAYGIFSRDFIKFIVNDPKAQHLLEWSRKTYSPDEHYWSTLHHTYINPHLKSPGGYSGIPDEKPWLAVFVAWGGVDKCRGMWKRGTCVFGVEDLPTLLPKHELFANKFYENHQPVALECLIEWVQYKAMCPDAVPFDYEYYKSLPFIK